MIIDHKSSKLGDKDLLPKCNRMHLNAYQFSKKIKIKIPVHSQTPFRGGKRKVRRAREGAEGKGGSVGARGFRGVSCPRAPAEWGRREGRAVKNLHYL
jgi:hypothetical protein